KAFLYQTWTFFLMAASLMTRKRQRCVLPPLGAHTPAWRILRSSAAGTGSGFSRRMARVVWMISKRSVFSGMLVLPGGAYSRPRQDATAARSRAGSQARD